MASIRHSQSPEDGDPSLSAHQRTMMDACASGDVQRLHELFNQNGVKRGDPPVEWRLLQYPKMIATVPASGPPSASQMVNTAVANQQPSILALLLTTYPSLSVQDDCILNAACANPDLDVFKMLHSRYPGIINHEEYSGFSTALIEACHSGNPLIPNYLLDHGANPELGGLRGMAALYSAVIAGQPVTLIAKMVDCGAILRSSAVAEAVRYRRIEQLPFLLRQYHLLRPKETLNLFYSKGL